jgi:hypothetical protein
MRAENFRNPFSIFGYLLEWNRLSKSGEVGPNLGKFSQEFFFCRASVISGVGRVLESAPPTLHFPGPGIMVPPRSIPKVLKTTTQIVPRVFRCNHGSQLLKTEVPPGGQKWNRSSHKAVKGENTPPGGDRNPVL